jgi:hypothetical protein
MECELTYLTDKYIQVMTPNPYIKRTLFMVSPKFCLLTIASIMTEKYVTQIHAATTPLYIAWAIDIFSMLHGTPPNLIIKNRVRNRRSDRSFACDIPVSILLVMHKQISALINHSSFSSSSFLEKLQTATEHIGLPNLLYVFYEGTRIVWAVAYWFNPKLSAA